jgi:hypothetical protein
VSDKKTPIRGVVIHTHPFENLDSAQSKWSAIQARYSPITSENVVDEVKDYMIINILAFTDKILRNHVEEAISNAKSMAVILFPLTRGGN